MREWVLVWRMRRAHTHTQAGWEGRIGGGAANEKEAAEGVGGAKGTGRGEENGGGAMEGCRCAKKKQQNTQERKQHRYIFVFILSPKHPHGSSGCSRDTAPPTPIPQSRDIYWGPLV